MKVKEASYWDARYVSRNLRPADIQEILLYSADPPDITVMKAWDMTPGCMVVKDSKGDPAILYGVTPSPHNDPRGGIWLLATTRVSKVAKSFLQASSELLKPLQAQYPAGLHCYVDTRNTLHLRWVALLGFTAQETIRFNADVSFTHYELKLQPGTDELCAPPLS